MAPKRRVHNKHLPQRVYIKHGAYFYVDKNNKWIKLGRNFHEAMASWAKLVNAPKTIRTMAQLFDRYMIEIAPFKAAKSYKDNQKQIKYLKIALGDMDPEDVTPVIIYQYMDRRGVVAKVSANREKALLSHCFSMAVRWGVVKDNPCKNVKGFTEKPRVRYITDDEFQAVRNIAPDVIKFAMDFSYLTGQRPGDVLKTKLSDLTEDGIIIVQNKTEARMIIEWTPELRVCVQNIKSLQRSVRGFTLFCTERGKPYTTSGFSSMWQRVMKRALALGVINERFTFYDFRAKTASDSKNIQDASNLLGHSNAKITERVYNRKEKKVKPLK